MCRPATCNRCGKTTWAGCGEHVDQVLAGVPQADRCVCEPRQPRGSLFGRLFQTSQR